MVVADLCLHTALMVNVIDSQLLFLLLAHRGHFAARYAKIGLTLPISEETAASSSPGTVSQL